MRYLPLHHPRALARMRTHIPLLPFLLVLIVGQVSFFAISGRWIAMLLVTALVVGMRRKGQRYAISWCAVFLLGYLLSHSSLPDLKPFPPKDSPFLALIDSEPRYPTPGLVRLSITILESSPNNAGVPHWKATGPGLLCSAIDLPWRAIAGARKGDVYLVRGAVRTIEDKGLLSYEQNLLRKGYTGTCKIRYARKLLTNQQGWLRKWRDSSLHEIRQGLGEGERAGLVLSMAFGIRDQISARTEAVFRRCGLSHLLVLSGYQVSLVFYALQVMLRSFLRAIPKLYLYCAIDRVASFAALMVSCGFVWFTVVESSSIRAIIAAGVVVLSCQLERGGGFFQGILVSLLVLSLLWPACILEPGVQLTYAALFGIGVASSYADSSVMIAGLRVCLYTSLCTSAVVACWFEGLSVVGFLLNPIVAPICALLSCNVGLIAMVLGWCGASSLAAWLFQTIATYLELARDLLAEVSEPRWSYLVIEGVWKVPVVMILLLLVAVIAYRRLNRFLCAQNILSPWSRNVHG